MSKILMLANDGYAFYMFRMEVIERFVSLGHEVYVSFPDGPHTAEITALGCEHIDTPVNSHGTNPLQDMKLMKRYKQIMKDLRPDVVLTYTIKSNVYGGMAAKSLNIPYIANVTGMGRALENPGMMQKITTFLYKLGLSGAASVFFQNERNEAYFNEHGIAAGRHRVLPGSGVNLQINCPEPYPEEKPAVKFVFAARIHKDKGTEQLFEAIERVKSTYKNIEFHIAGWVEHDEDTTKIRELSQNAPLVFHGALTRSELQRLIKESHCVIHPSHHEGMSNMLLEGAANGRPCLASNVAGCKEPIEDGTTGFLFDAKNTQSLCDSIGKFMALTTEERAEMGKNGRLKMEREFDKEFVIEAYVSALGDVCSKKSEKKSYAT